MSIREKGRKRLNNIGFTLVEMMVVLTMMTIVLGVSAWGVTGWIQHSEFLKNEANAQTIYLAAQSALSNADSKGTSDSIISRIYNEANSKGNFIDASETSKKTEYGIPTLADNEGNMHRYAALTVTKGQYSSGDDSVLFDIISPYIFYTYDPYFLDVCKYIFHLVIELAESLCRKICFIKNCISIRACCSSTLPSTNKDFFSDVPA